MTVAVPTVDALYAQAGRRLPDDYAPVLPLLGAAAAANRKVAVAIDAWAALATPSTSTAKWLDLLARGCSLYRKPDETDASLRQRIANLPKRVTPASIEAAVNAILDPDTCIVVEHWKAQLYCCDGVTEYVTDAYCGEDNLLGVHNGVTVVCPAGLDEDVELAVCAAINLCRAAGIRCWAMFIDGFDPIMGLRLEEP